MPNSYTFNMLTEDLISLTYGPDGNTEVVLAADATDDSSIGASYTSANVTVADGAGFTVENTNTASVAACYDTVNKRYESWRAKYFSRLYITHCGGCNYDYQPLYDCKK